MDVARLFLGRAAARATRPTGAPRPTELTGQERRRDRRRAERGQRLHRARRVGRAAGRARRRGLPARLRGRAPLFRRRCWTPHRPEAVRPGHRGASPPTTRAPPSSAPPPRLAAAGRARRPRTSSPTAATTSCAPGRPRRHEAVLPRRATAPQPLTPERQHERKSHDVAHHVRRVRCSMQTAPRQAAAAGRAGRRPGRRAGPPRTGTRCAHVVAEHGAVLVRGLGLRDAGRDRCRVPGVLGGRLMTEREAFAPRAGLRRRRVLLDEVAGRTSRCACTTS